MPIVGGGEVGHQMVVVTGLNPIDSIGTYFIELGIGEVELVEVNLAIMLVLPVFIACPEGIIVIVLAVLVSPYIIII